MLWYISINEEVYKIMEVFLEILQKFGLPVMAASAMGTFIYIILKYILGGVVNSV